MSTLEYLNDRNKDLWVLDLEADDLKATKIWIVCCKNVNTEEEKEFPDKDTFNDWLHLVRPILVGHNILSFDAPVLNRLWDSRIDLSLCIDTLVLSLLWDPALGGGHSLKTWGERLGYPKGEFSDWSHLSQKMKDYCWQDVRLTRKVYLALCRKMKQWKFSNLSCLIEHKIRVIINDQQDNGFYFDEIGGRNLLRLLRERQADLTKQLQSLFLPVEKEIKRCPFERTKGGDLPSRIEKARDRYHRVEVLEDRGEYVCYDLLEFNIGSPKQRVERLLELGWVPTKFTEKGFPKVDEDALLRFAEEKNSEAARSIAEWLVLQGRSSMVEGWLNNLGPDSRIHGRVNSCGATTRRMTHSNPNTANIPSGAKAKYGHECRALWCVEPNKGLILVGCDASGLENVGLLHYLNNPKATELLTQKKPNDVHSLNAREMTKALGFECDREWAAKTSFFALIFGAGDEKLGSIVKKGKQEGAIVREVIIKNIPGLKGLIDDIQLEFKRTGGLLRCIDDGLVHCPSFNAALNYIVQSSGAIVMKLACIILHEEARKQNLWFQLNGFIHDEWQMTTKKEDGERLGKLAVWSIEEAARQLKFNVSLSGEFKLGQSWDETH